MSNVVKQGLPTESWKTRGVAILVGVLVLALAAPLIWNAVAAGIGLAVLGGIVLGVLAVIQCIPMLGQKLENKILGARKAEARANPIEQQQNESRRRAEQINATQKALSAINGQIETMKDMIADRRREDPTYDFTQQERSLEKMKQFYQARCIKLSRAQKALVEYNKMIERNIFNWEFAKKGRVALQSLNASDQEAIMQGILSDESNRAVQEEFNSVCADLDVEVMQLNSTKALSFDNGTYLDLSSINIPTAVKV